MDWHLILAVLTVGVVSGLGLAEWLHTRSQHAEDLERTPTRGPDMATAPSKRALLTLAEIAEIIGVQPATTALYHHRANRNRREGTVRPGDFPAPDQMVGRIPTWKRGTIDKWAAKRPSTNWKREPEDADAA